MLPNSSAMFSLKHIIPSCDRRVAYSAAKCFSVFISVVASSARTRALDTLVLNATRNDFCAHGGAADPPSLQQQRSVSRPVCDMQRVVRVHGGSVVDAHVPERAAPVEVRVQENPPLAPETLEQVVHEQVFWCSGALAY